AMASSMPAVKAFEATRRIKKERADVKFLILSVYDDEDLVARCLDAGASGYVLKDSPPPQLAYAIQAVSRGQQYMSPRVLTTVVRQFINSGPAEPKTGYDLLSDLERVILVMLA